ncbi:MAG: caspase family protein, partial [Dongiaceae bacterium]
MAPSGSTLARNLLAALVLVAGLFAASAADAARVALVVGNSAYTALPQLRNPANDSALLADALTRIGFEVVRVNDVDQPGLLAAVERFGEIARGAEVAVFYFAGHGVQFGGTNYLLPVEATLGSEADLRGQGLDVDLVIEKFRAAVPRSGVLILDACRDNPLPVSVAGATRGLKVAALTSGLARVEGVSGILIAYATAPGQVAYDGAGANSPFVAALAHYLGEPGLGVSDLFIRVRQRVMESTAGAQIPWVEEALLEPLYMHPAEAQTAPPTDVARLNGALEIEEPEKKLAALVDLEGALSDPTMQPVVAGHIESLREEEVVTEAPSVRLVRELVDWHRLRIIESRPAARLAAGAFLAIYPQGIFVDPAGSLAEGDATADPAAEISEADAESVWTLIAQADQPALFDRFIQEVPSGRFTELAQARRTIWLADLTGGSLLPETVPEVAPTEPTAQPSADRSTDTAPLADRTTLPVFVGTGPTAIALPMTPALLQVTAPPKYGTLILERDDGTVAEVRAATAGEPSAVRALSYRPDAQARDAVDEFVIATVMPTGRGLSIVNQAQTDAQAQGTQAQGQTQTQPTDPLAPDQTQTAQSAPMTVRADIKPHECDLEAGARFDTQGVVAGNYSTELKPEKAVPACRQAVDAFPDVARFRYQLGRALDAAGEPEEAAELFRQAADAGHIAALYELGRHHERGDGVAKDLAEALRLYKDAAGRNDLYAATRLGVLYRDGIGVDRDVRTAVDWLVKAARGGHTFAYNHLGYMYLEGNGVEKDDERAYRLFEASANAGDVYGFNNMGLMYERGAFVPADPAQAVVWYEKAARGGQPQAPINLGLMYLGDRGIDADPARAAYWFAEAAKLDNAWGFTNLGWLYQTGRGVDSDPELAADLYARALRLDPEGEAGAGAAKNFDDLPRQAGIRLIQNRLLALGFDPGEPDGAWGKRSRDAVAAFAEGEGVDIAADAPPIRILIALLDAADRRAAPKAP